jgi:hypothetical protein
MSFTVNYNLIPELARAETALQDIEDYLGQELFEKVFLMLTENLGDARLPWEKLSFTERKAWINAINIAMSLLGVRGYPVRVYRRWFLEQVTDTIRFEPEN